MSLSAFSVYKAQMLDVITEQGKLNILPTQERHLQQQRVPAMLTTCGT